MLKNSEYKVLYAYTLGEVFKTTLGVNYPWADGTIYNPATIFTAYGMSFPSNITSLYICAKNTDLMNLFFNRYWDEYIFEIPEDEVNDTTKYVRRFLAKWLHILEFTYDKYKSLLDVYTSATLDLTKKLERIIDEDGSNTGSSNHTLGNNSLTKDNDTPQGEGDFSDDEHTSFISSTSNAGYDNRTDTLANTRDINESWDDEPLIQRLDKINKLYLKTMEAWLDEFKDLFVEGGNYQ